MSLFVPGVATATDQNNNPLAGAKWEFYSVGTITPEALANGEFVSGASDANGDFAQITLDSSTVYRAILKDADGKILVDIPNNSKLFNSFIKAAAKDAGADAGTVTPGAAWHFSGSGNLIPKQVYADPDLTTPLGSVVVSDAEGKFPPIYLDDTITYRARLIEADGTGILTIDPVNNSNELSYLDPDGNYDTTTTYGALSRNSEGAGILVTGTAVSSGDPSGHWTVSNGRLYPSAQGDTDDLNAGPYSLTLDDGSTVDITIEADTWDCATQAEWDALTALSVAAASNIAGKAIALRNDTALDLKIDGTSSGIFQNDDYGTLGDEFVLKGRFGEVGAWADYCEVGKFGTFRGVRHVKLQHIRTTASAESKLTLISATNAAGRTTENVTVDDCWISGAVGDPNGDYTTSSNFPNFGIDLVNMSGIPAGMGDFTVTNSLIEWGAVLVNIGTDGSGSTFTCNNNEIRYYYGDAITYFGSAGRVPGGLVCEGNFIHSCVGRSDDSGNAHADSIRVAGTPTSTGDLDVLIRNNVILPGNSRGDAQGIFLDDMKSGGVDSGHFFTGTIANNLVQVVETGIGLSTGQPKNMTYSNNTVVGANDPALNTTDVFISMGRGLQATDGGGNLLNDNICETVFDSTNGSSGTSSGNVELGLNGVTIPYASTFVGPGSDPWRQVGTKADAQAVFTVLSGSAGASFT